MITAADGTELKTGMFISIGWSDGSALRGQISIDDNGLTSLRFGPEDDPRWIVIGSYRTTLPFVRSGVIQIVAE